MHFILADDQFDVRQALICLLENEVKYELVSEAASADELLTWLIKACPDLLLLDWELSGVNGRDLLLKVRALCPHVKVIALSGRPEAFEEALAAGADGFVSKGDPPDCLLTEIHKVAPPGAP